ncbi:MAG TPA: translocation/assembly module TamB domain-containing protein, partial [Spirochaetia bacterium]|nr:translocation/assembly module TamB domain-containing protein [Spirochaetia bacterium]
GSTVSADFTVDRHGSSVVAKSRTIVVGKAILHGVGISVSPSPDSIRFSVGASFDEKESQFTGTGTIYLSHTPYVLLSLGTLGIPLDQLYTLVAQEPLPSVMDTLKGLKMTSRVLITTDLKRFSFASPKVEITDGAKVPKRQMSLRISGNNRSLNLQDLNVDWWGRHVEGSVAGQYVQNDRVELSSTIKVENTNYSVHGFYQIGDSLILSGNFGIDLAAVNQGGRYVFTLRTDKLPIPFGKVVTRANLDLEGVYANPGEWEVVSRNTSFSDLPFLKTKTNSLSLSARLSSSGGDIYSMTYSDSVSTLSGNGKISLSDHGPGFSGNGWVQLVGSNQGESYSANFAFAPGNLDASINFANSPLSRLGRLPVSGLVSGQVTIAGKPTSPDLSVRLSLPSGQIYTDAVTANVDFSVTNQAIHVRSLSARYLASALNGVSGKLDFKTGAFDLSGNYRGDVNGDIVSAHLAANGQATPIQSRRDLSTLLSGNLNASVRVTSITVENAPVPSWDVKIDKRQDRMLFTGGPGGGVSGYLLQSGSFRVSLAAPLPVILQADGQVTGSTINASLQNVSLDLHAFDSVAKIPYFDISKGIARGNLEITGSINDPDIQGDLVATDVYGKTPVISNEIGPFSTDLVFQGKSLSMSDVAIRSGNSQVLGNLNFTLDHWIPGSYDLSFATQGAQGVHVKYSISGIDFDGYATGTTTIKGDAQGPRIAGTLEINSCLITIGNTDQAAVSSTGPQPVNNASYNFTFTTGRQVQFVWPNNTVPILRAFADTGQTLNVTSDGSTGDFSIVGNINVKGGEVFYLRQNFYLRQGNIAFNEDQNKFDPIVNVRAELREVNAEGTPVSIFLVVNNKPLSQFAPSFESDPS